MLLKFKAIFKANYFPHYLQQPLCCADFFKLKRERHEMQFVNATLPCIETRLATRAKHGHDY